MSVTDRKLNSHALAFLESIDSLNYGGVNLSAAFACILDAIQHILPSRYANIWLTNEEQEFGSLTFPQTLSLVAATWHNDEITENTFLNLNDSFTGRTVLQNKIQRSNNLFSDKLFRNKELLKNVGAKCAISIPLCEPRWGRVNKATGVLNVYFSKAPKISDKNLIFISAQVSNAIEKLKLVHRDLVTSKLIVYHSGSLENHFKQSISALLNYGIEAVSIFSFDTSRKKLRLEATTGILNCSDFSKVRYDIGMGLTGCVGKYKKPIIIHDLKSKDIQNIHTGVYIEKTRNGLKSFMAYPITNMDNNLVGVIRCVNKVFKENHLVSFSQIDLNIIRRISRVLCQHMERANLERNRESLLAKIPHDLVAPIVAVRNNTHNIKMFRDHPDFSITRKLDDIIDDCNIMFLLVEQVKRKRTYDFKKVQMKGEIIVKLVKELKPLARSYGLNSLSYFSLDPIPYELYLDRVQIQHLFFNLIINAIKYSYKATDITISARLINNNVAIDIQNWGIGITENFVESIFEPEVRSPEAIEVDAKGTGWGLAISQEIAEKHNGKIVVLSLNNPTVFTLLLPISLTSRMPK